MYKAIFVVCFIFIFLLSGFCVKNAGCTEITGTYKIVFFGSQVVNNNDNKADIALEHMATKYYISNDCKKAKELYPDIINNGLRNICNLVTQSKILDGIVLVFYDKDNYLNVRSRIQLEGGVVDLSVPDRYQYSQYLPIKNKDVLSGVGLLNWNYDSLNNSPSSTSVSFLDSPFSITKLEDDKLRIDITLIGKNIKILGKPMTVNAINTVILEKMDINYTNLENKIQKKFSK